MTDLTRRVADIPEEVENDEDILEIGERELAYDDSDKAPGLYLVHTLTDTFQIWRWKLDRYSTRPEKFFSETFQVGGFDWRFNLFPRGNRQKKDISIYLDCPDAHNQRPGWTRYAEFRIGLINQKDLRKSKFQEARKRFHRGEPDWGFGNFFPLDKVDDESLGFRVNDTVILEVRIEVKKDQFSGYAYQDYDCRKETGYVGLRNQGATCYMNSLLQTLYAIPEFRRRVYRLQLPNVEEKDRNIPLALQRLFWQLQFSDDSVSTKRLTKSFGWDGMEAFVQHDVQELLRVLLDNLDMKMKGSELEGTMDEIFGGKVKNFIKCLNVDYESSREEPFYDIQLVVKNCKNVLESFDKEVEEETMDGENQYHAEGFGLQDARKGVRFVSLPPILMLQLKRFEYNWEIDQMHKINDRYEFPIDMNLDKYLTEDADRSIPNDYSLLSILVHSGDVHGGHYYAYIRPGLDDTWLKFDDERVTPAPESEAVEDNFGGEVEPEHEKPVSNFGYPNWDIPVGHVRRFQSIFKRYANAYMLVYVRRSELGRFMNPVEVEEIPEILREEFQNEEEKEAEERREKAESYLYSVIELVSDKMLSERRGFDLLGDDKDREIPTVRIKKSEPVSELKKLIAEKIGVPEANQRFWKFTQRQGGPRPTIDLAIRSDDVSVETALGIRVSYQSERMAIYVQNVEDGSAGGSIGMRNTLLFLKWYNPESQELRFIRTALVSDSDLLDSLASSLYDEVGLSADTPLQWYLETRASFDKLNSKLSVRDLHLGHGDLIVFEENSERVQQFERPTALSYFDFVVNRIVVKMRKLEEPETDCFELELMKNMRYTDVTSAIGSHIGVPSENIRLTAHSTYLNAPRQGSIRSTDNRKLREMLYFGNTWSDILYYEPLELSVAEVENKKELSLHFFDDHVQEKEKLKLIVPRSSRISDLYREVCTKLNLPVETKLRILEVFNGKLQKIFKDHESVEWLHDYGHVMLRVEVVSPEELNAGDNERVVTVQHFCKDSVMAYRAFGEPFFIKISDSDTFGSFKERIREKLQPTEEDEFDSWKVAIVSFQRATYFKEDDLVLEAFDKNKRYSLSSVVGLEHKDKAMKKPESAKLSSNLRVRDAPIKIYN